MKSIVLSILIGISFYIPAQSVLIKAKIVDGETSEPIPFATLSVYTPDPALVTGGIAGLDGTIELTVEPGLYYGLIQVLSYETRKVNLTVPDQGVLNIGKIKLNPNIQTLDDVIVRAERGLMQMDLEKKIFNVAEDLSNVGRTASEILDNIPAVAVDQDGGISLRGSSNVRILVDGKPSGLVGISSTNALQTLQGSMIERIEVVTNPSVRYEAEGTAGIINIVLKKERQSGMNGVFEGNLGHPLNSGLSATMNYRTRKLNYFINYGSNYRERPGRASAYQNFFLGDTTYSTRSTRDFLRTGWSHNLRAGFDLFVNDKNTITASFQLNRRNNSNYTDITYSDFDSMDELFQVKDRGDTEREGEKNLEYVLSYEKTFDQEGRKLTFYSQYRDNIETEESALKEDLVFATDSNADQQSLSQRSFNRESETNLLLQADYVQPFGEKGKFETGYRGTIRNIRTDYFVEELIGDEWTNLVNFSNNFQYDENIQAFYALAGNHKGKISYEAGLRMEFTSIKTTLIQTDEKFDKSYVNLFPSIHTKYHFNQKNSMQVSYSRRISRPGFWWLNPFSSFSDPRNIRVGNPDLNPQFTDSYETGFLSNNESSSLYGGIYYRHTTGVTDRISTVEEGVTFSKPVNLSVENAFGIEANVSQDIRKWWTVNGNVNFYRAVTEGEFEGLSLYRDTYTWNTRINNRFTFWNRTNFQFTLVYRAPQQTTQGRRESFYTVDVGVNKEVLKGKGTLSLGIRDLFNTRIYRGTSSGLTFYSETKYQRSFRQAVVSFVCRINQKKVSKREDEDREENFEMDF